MNLVRIQGKKHLDKDKNNKKNPENAHKLRCKQKWIFPSNRSIESDDIHRNKCLLYKQKVQLIAAAVLWLNIFFLHEYQIKVYFAWLQYKRYLCINKEKYYKKLVMFDVLYMLEQQNSNFLG